MDAGLDLGMLKAQLGNLRINFAVSKSKRGNRPACRQAGTFQSQVSEHFKLLITKARKNGLTGTFFDVKIAKKDHHRNLKDILKIINQSKLSKEVKELSTRIFRRLAEAEAKVHGMTVNQVHFHEVGAIDAIVDIVGFCIGLEIMGIEKVYCSPLPNGQGVIKHAHGLLPNPAPATAELLRGIPTYNTKIKGELVTPTGAAIMSTVAEFTDPPRMIVTGLGYGAGSLALPQPNLLRLFVGAAQLPAEHDTVLLIEANIDDLNPKLYGKTIKKLMRAGALDAFISPIIMKKERRAFKLSVLVRPELRDKILTEFFNSTTTFGIRVYLASREVLKREFRTVKTKYGRAKVKLGYLGERLTTLAPEYEGYKRLSKKHRLSLATIHREIVDRAIASL